jgi:hypothetical protein
MIHSEKCLPDVSKLMRSDKCLPHVSKMIRSKKCILHVSKMMRSDKCLPHVSKMIPSEKCLPHVSKMIHSDKCLPHVSKMMRSDNCLPHVDKMPMYLLHCILYISEWTTWEFLSVEYELNCNMVLTCEVLLIYIHVDYILNIYLFNKVPITANVVSSNTDEARLTQYNMM